MIWGQEHSLAGEGLSSGSLWEGRKLPILGEVCGHGDHFVGRIWRIQALPQEIAFSLLGLPLQNPIAWEASATETRWLTVLEAGSSRSRCQGWFLLKGSQQLGDSQPPTLSSRGLFSGRKRAWHLSLLGTPVTSHYRPCPYDPV